MTTTTYPVHTIDTAPEGSRALLKDVRSSLGALPNLAAAMAESPALVRSFFAVREIYKAGTLGARGTEVLSLTNAVENDCDWCVAFHSMMAEKSGVPAATIAALRSRGLPADERDRALATLSRELIRRRGDVGEPVLAEFRAAGFSSAQVLEVILGIAFSTMANYAQHVVRAPLDGMLEAYRWSVVPSSIDGA